MSISIGFSCVQINCIIVYTQIFLCSFWNTIYSVFFFCVSFKMPLTSNQYFPKSPKLCQNHFHVNLVEWRLRYLQIKCLSHNKQTFNKKSQCKKSRKLKGTAKNFQEYKLLKMNLVQGMHLESEIMHAEYRRNIDEVVDGWYLVRGNLTIHPTTVQRGNTNESCPRTRSSDNTLM